jgi:hypothetical protein
MWLKKIRLVAMLETINNEVFYKIRTCYILKMLLNHEKCQMVN